MDSAGIHVAKIGGDNAGDFRANYQTVLERLSAGKKQILVVSAVRSSLPVFNSLADAAVTDTASDGKRKHGFNTTSHLIEAARSLDGSDAGRHRAAELCERIGDFTRLAVRKNLEGYEDEDLILNMEGAVGEVMDREGAPHSLARLLRQSGTTEQHGEDWEFVTQKKEEGTWLEDERRSITGAGEELGQALYAKYFRMKGMNVGRLSIHTDAMQAIARGKPVPPFDAQHLRENIALQLQWLLQGHDVVVAGGYLPGIGGQRGYSDKTGALIAQAAGTAGYGSVAYLIEKQFPIMSGDPTRLQGARVISKMSYFLAKELFGNAHGANGAAIHPGAVDLLAESKIPTVVHNPHDADQSRKTLITDYNPSPNGIEIVAARKVPVAIELCDTTMIGNYGFLAKVTAFFAAEKISIDQVATSEGSVSLTFTEDLPSHVLEKLKSSLNWEFGSRREEEQTLTVHILRNKSLIYCLGNNMKRPGIAARATLALQLADADIHLITQGLNECVMTFLIDDDKVADALSLLHDFCIVLPEEKTAGLLQEFKAKIRAAMKPS